MKKVTAFLIHALLTAQLSAQPSSANWSVSMEPAKRFIENKSQFDGKNNLPGSQILYGVDHGAVQIFFTQSGLTYRLHEKRDKDEHQEREIKKKIREGKIRPEEVPVLYKTDFIHLQWLDANPSARLLALDPSTDYFSYAVGDKSDQKNINHIKGFKRLMYENLYPGIDVEYVFHPQTGIKYNIILHPGADLSRVKMKYAGAKNIRADEQGNIRITTEIGDIIDHAPRSFYEKKSKKEIPSRFLTDGSAVSFHLENYNPSKTVIIDPWVVTPNLPLVNKAYYIKSDGSGNAYIFGGDSPHRLLKYDPAGNLLWTYNTPWSSGGGNWFGGLTVDFAGNSIVTAGTGVSISQVNTNGGLVWSNSPGNFYEYWTPVFNCDYTQLLIGGTWLQNAFLFEFNGAVFDINVNTGAQNSFKIVANTLVGAPGNPPFVPNEVRSICTSPNGNYYYLTLDSLGSLSPSFNIDYSLVSGYTLSYYLPYGQGGSGQGINAIVSTPYFIYTTNGQVLNKRDISSGNLINSVFVPSGGVEVCSGIAVDSCGNVYVGSVGRVVKYDGNLNLISFETTPGEVYDVSVTNNGEVLACGNQFAVSLAMSACNPVRNYCYEPFPVEVTTTDVSCNGSCNGSATATPLGGIPPYTYFWSNGQTGPTATNLCAGAYVVTVTDSTNSISIASAVITEPALLTLSVTSEVTNCGTSAIATPASGVSPYAFEWSNGSTEAVISGLATGTYSVTVIDGNNCSATGSVSVTQSPGLTATAAFTNPDCGACDGTANVTPVDGTPPFEYEWSNGDTTQTVTGLCPGVYNVTITEVSTGGNLVFWSENFTGGSAGWTLNNNSGTNGNAPNRWIVNTNRNAGCAVCPPAGSGGNYLHITCDDASFFCAAMGGPSCVYGQGFPLLFDNTTDRFASSPNISTIGKTNITLSFWYISAGSPAVDYGTVRLSNDGGATWTDLPTQYAGVSTCTQEVISIPSSYENISNFRIGFRWVNDNDGSGNDPAFVIDDIELSAPVEACSAIATLVLNSDDGATVTIDSIKNVSCKNGNDGAINISVSGGNPPYAYAWSNGAVTQDVTGLTPGTYLVTVLDNAGCAAIEIARVSEPGEIFIAGIVTNATCNAGGSIDISVSGGTPPYAYAWSNGSTTQDVIDAVPGAHIVTVTDNNGCEKTGAYSIGFAGISVALSKVDGTCGGANDGSVTSTIFGGSPPYQYAWSTGDTTANLAAVDRGVYTLTVTDNSGCSATQTAIITAPDPITAIASITRAFCSNDSDGNIKLIPSSGTPDYTAEWSHGYSGFEPTALAPDVYTVTVTDSRNCTAEFSYSLNSVSDFNVAVDVTDAFCDGSPTGTAQAVVTGSSAPFTYAWSAGGTDISIANLAPGIYRLSVSDSLSCLIVDTFEIGARLRIEETIIKPCPGDANGSIIVNVTGGVQPYSYQWDNGATAASLVNISAGVYALTVNDVNNCSGEKTFLVETDSTPNAVCDTLIFYDVFSPNGDGVNDLWVIDGLHRFPDNEIQVFNRWGNAVFEARPYNNDWDGRTKKGERAPSATYYYILKLHDAKNSVFSGNVTLVR